MKTIIRPETEMKNSGIEWIGNIPQNWDAVQIRRVLLKDKNGIKIGPFGSALTNKTTGNDEYYVYSQANLVSGDFSNTKNKVSQDVFNSLSNYEVVTGDVCLSMMGTIGKCRIIPHNIKKGIMDSHLIKIRLDNYNSRFFEYVYDKDNGGICFVQMQKEKKGSIMDGLNTSIVKGLYVTVPPLSEQQAIADYLDKTCSKINEIIAEAKESIDEYKELKRSVIFEAVTKGLDKNVEMKDSGIEWIGEIPNDAKLVPLKYLVSKAITDGTHQTPDYESSENGSPFLSSKDISSGKIDFSNIKYITKKLHEELYRNVAPQINDVLLAKNGTTGVAALVEKDMVFDIYVTLALIRPDVTKVLPKYLLHGINCYVAKRQFDEHLLGIGVPNLHLSVIRNTKVIIHNKNQQKKIADFLDKRTAEIDDLIAEKESLINDLEAYKKSLIYEVVTGKRRVV